MVCRECKWSVGGHPSTSCPLAGRLPDKALASFSAGCSLGIPATVPQPPRPATTDPSPDVQDVPKRKARVGHPRQPNSTELRYKAEHLAGKDARYEALTFHMTNGHSYTPDWVVFDGGRPTEAHECKGSYKLHSHGRAQLAFDQAKVEFPGLEWIWHAEKKKKKAKPCADTE
jgi:hypothetical protein